MATKKFCVACNSNAEGEPDLFFCEVECTEQQHEEGDSYEMARQKAIDNDYEGPFVAFSEDDTAGKVLIEHFVWDSLKED